MAIDLVVGFDEHCVILWQRSLRFLAYRLIHSHGQTDLVLARPNGIFGSFSYRLECSVKSFRVIGCGTLAFAL